MRRAGGTSAFCCCTTSARAGARPNLARLAEALNAEGYAVLAIDFRGHGESTHVGAQFGQFPHNRGVALAPRPPGRPGGMNDVAGTITFRSFPPAYFVRLVNDIAAAKAFLDNKDRAGQVDAANLVLVGIGDGASIGTLWLATESARFRLAEGATPGPGAKYAPLPEVRHVAGGIWLNFHLTVGGVDRTTALANWLQEAGRTQQTPMTFLYNRLDAVGRRNAANAIAALAPPPRGTSAVAVNADARGVGHNLLAQNYGAEKIILRTVKAMLVRPDGANQVPRPSGAATWWVIAGTALPAREEGAPAFHPVPVERFGIRR